MHALWYRSELSWNDELGGRGQMASDSKGVPGWLAPLCIKPKESLVGSSSYVRGKVDR